MRPKTKIALRLELFAGALAVGAMLVSSPDLHGQCAGSLQSEQIWCESQSCEGYVDVQIPEQWGGMFWVMEDYSYCCGIGEPNFEVLGYCVAPVKGSPAKATDRTRETYAWILGCDGTYHLASLPA